MGNVLDVIATTPAAGSAEPPTDSNFDPRPYFDQWTKDLEAARLRLNSHEPSDQEVSEFFFKSLPGSNGELIFEGVLHFDGHSMGNILSPDGTLVVTKRGVVDADIEVGTALIYGSVKGNITANERVFLGDDARVTGQIQTRLLSVKPGAVFVGDCLFTPPAHAPLFEEELSENEHQAEELDRVLVAV